MSWDPTRTVALWLGNDEGLYLQAVELAEAARDDDHPEDKLAETLREFITGEVMPGDGAGLTTDLLTHALGGVDWHDLADNYLEDDAR